MIRDMIVVDFTWLRCAGGESEEEKLEPLESYRALSARMVAPSNQNSLPSSGTRAVRVRVCFTFGKFLRLARTPIVMSASSWGGVVPSSVTE